MENSIWTSTELTPGQKHFPRRLKTLPYRPELLHLAGTWDWLDLVPCVAIVGSRQASPWGSRTAYEVACGIAGRGWGVVSGLALGIDTAAHRGALSRTGRTGATLPCGLERIYPPENLGLAAEMIDGGGFLMSEYPAYTEAAAKHFLARDRLQSALATAVLVIETEATGGTMHTARFAIEQRRPLLVFEAPRGCASNTSGNLVLGRWEGTLHCSSVGQVMGILEVLTAEGK